jgi:acetyltransferase-like isoleucine patch superfamily enzyme
LLFNSKQRVKYLKKHEVFSQLGDNIFYQYRGIPVEPNLIKIHDNVAIAANISIIPHDIIHMVYNNLSHTVCGKYKIHLGCIEIMDNCFIGSHSIILSDVKIGPNSIVAAGAIVTKDVLEVTIVGGNPAKVIGSFDGLMEKRKCDIGVSDLKVEREYRLWKNFDEKHK